MKNIFYFRKINEIGGIETFFYQLAKKYKDYDITIYYNDGDSKQIKRLKKYVDVKKYQGEEIICDKAFFNFNIDIIDNVKANEYIQIVHGDYKAMNIKPNTHHKITKYFGVSKQVCKTFKEVTGFDCELVYNPIEIEKPKKVLNLISATRLTAEKGKNRIIKLAKLLEENNIPYLWTIFTDDTNSIKNPNIIYMKPKLDIINYIANADYLVQLSDNEGYCYSVIESLCVGTPVIVTECPVFKELGIRNGENGFILDFDLDNINIKAIYESRLNFKYEPNNDTWYKYLAKGESQYQKKLKSKCKVQCIEDFYDIENNNKLRTKEDKPFIVNKVRAEELEQLGLVEILK